MMRRYWSYGLFFFFASRRRHTRSYGDWSSDVCSSDLNVVLQRTKGNNSGWIVIAAGWAFAVTIAVYSVNSISGAHINPAVKIGRASCRERGCRRVEGRCVEKEMQVGQSKVCIEDSRSC